MNEQLDVAVNLLWLAPGRVGGSEEYLTRQLTGIPDDAGVAPTLFCQPAFGAAHPELSKRFPTKAVPFDRDWRGVRLLAEHTWLPWKTRRADVIHHGGGTVPLVGGGAVLLTIHDLQYLEYPEHFSAARLQYLRRMLPRSVRKAATIATPSAFVRDTVLGAFGVADDRVVVVPHGVPELVQPDRAARDDVRRRWSLGDRRFVVYPAITHPHKDHAILIEMLGSLDTDIALVLIGGAGGAEADVVAAIEAHTDRVVRPGRVSDRERDALVAEAEALVFPSRYEGFGAPLVEAMELATPIVCSDHAAVREVVGDAAVIVSERSGEAWSAGVREAIERRDALVARGRDRRRQFTTDVSGAALVSAYRQAASR